MIEIKINEKNKKGIEVEAKIEILGYHTAVHQFVAVLMALDETSEDVLADAIGKYLEIKMEGDDDDESEG